LAYRAEQPHPALRRLFMEKRMRVLTLLVRYGTDKYAAAEKEIDEIFSRRMPQMDRSTIVIDNALRACERGHTPCGNTLIAGDNEFWEFSGWDRGLAYIGKDIWSYDLVHLATSAFNTLYTSYLHRFKEDMLHAVAARPKCLGHIDCYNDAIEIGNYRSQHWLRTSFLFVPPAELKTLGSLVSLHQKDQLLTDDPNNPFRQDCPLSKNYQVYLLDWLTGGGTGQGVQWHSRFTLDESTLPFFKKKVLAIINEHMLAIRLRASGCKLIDVTWLATKLLRRPPHKIPWNTPWRLQLSERDTDPITLPAS
jgi:hypothetical protein